MEGVNPKWPSFFPPRVQNYFIHRVSDSRLGVSTQAARWCSGRDLNPHTRRGKTKSRWHNADKFSSFPGPSAYSQCCMHIRQDTANSATWADAWREHWTMDPL